MIESESSFYMLYGSKDVDSILPSKLIHDANLIGATNRVNFFNLTHEILDENQIYDRGKKFCWILMARGHHSYIVRVVVSYFK